VYGRLLSNVESPVEENSYNEFCSRRHNIVLLLFGARIEARSRFENSLGYIDNVRKRVTWMLLTGSLGPSLRTTSAGVLLCRVLQLTRTGARFILRLDQHRRLTLALKTHGRKKVLVDDEGGPV